MPFLVRSVLGSSGRVLISSGRVLISSGRVVLLHSPSSHEVQFGFFGTFAVPFRPLPQGICEVFMFFFLFHVGMSATSADLEFRRFDLTGMLAVLYRAIFTLFYPLGLISSRPILSSLSACLWALHHRPYMLFLCVPSTITPVVIGCNGSCEPCIYQYVLDRFEVQGYSHEPRAAWCV